MEGRCEPGAVQCGPIRESRRFGLRCGFWGLEEAQKYVQRGLASIPLARTQMGPEDLNLI